MSVASAISRKVQRSVRSSGEDIFDVCQRMSLSDDEEEQRAICPHGVSDCQYASSDCRDEGCRLVALASQS